MSRRPIAVEWWVKGYGVYRRMPHPDINMYLLPEQNIYDVNSFKVMIPAIHRKPPGFRDQPTNDQQTMRYIAGEVMAGLNKVFIRLTVNNYILTSDIYCTYLGRISPTNGDGLECSYYLYLPKRNFCSAMRVFEEILTTDQLDKLYC